MISITQEVKYYTQAQPEYAEVLQVYEVIRQLQEHVINFCHTENCLVDAQTSRQRLLAGQPILQGEYPKIEPKLFHAFAIDLLQVLPESWPLKTEVEQTLQKLYEMSISQAISPSLLPADLPRLQLFLQDLAAAYLRNRAACLEILAANTGVSLTGVGFVLQTLFSPFYEQTARPLRQHVADHLWTKNICPICGGPPQMAKLTAAGNQRRLGCGLCHTEWVYPRTGCPFCGEGRPDNLSQFHLDNDRRRRVDVCKSCGGYIKTVDERELRRSTHLPVEDIITAHLDVLAQRQGYQ